MIDIEHMYYIITKWMLDIILEGSIIVSNLPPPS